MQLFFIVGAQKSGTTWLQRLLNTVSHVVCMGEGHFIDRLVMPAYEIVKSYNTMMETVSETVYEGNGFYQKIPDSEFAMMMRTWILKMLERNAGVSQAYAIGDKTPAHSFHLKTLNGLFPQAKYIHMIRDGRDATVSAYFHRKRLLVSYGKEQELRPFEYEAPLLFAKWASFARAVLDYQDKSKAPIYSMKYEDLLLNGGDSLNRCLEYLLPQCQFSEDEISQAIQKNEFSAQSGGRPPGVSDELAFLRKGVAGSWRDMVTPTIFSTFAEKDIDVLLRLGYLV